MGLFGLYSLQYGLVLVGHTQQVPLSPGLVEAEKWINPLTAEGVYIYALILAKSRFWQNFKVQSLMRHRTSFKVVGKRVPWTSVLHKSMHRL